MIAEDGKKTIYWHRDLPPLEAEAVGEHTIEATSAPVPGRFFHGDDIWDRSYEDLMTRVRARFEQEIARLGGGSAHVLNESVDSRHDEASGHSWLHGLFTYMLYR